MKWQTLVAIMLAPLGAWLVSLPVRAFVRFVWKRLPDGRLRRALFKDVRFMDEPRGWKRWDQ